MVYICILKIYSLVNSMFINIAEKSKLLKKKIDDPNPSLKRRFLLKKYTQTATTYPSHLI